eukprot:4186313-Alexandrium_andersonii.AAC.1
MVFLVDLPHILWALPDLEDCPLAAGDLHLALRVALRHRVSAEAVLERLLGEAQHLAHWAHGDVRVDLHEHLLCGQLAILELEGVLADGHDEALALVLDLGLELRVPAALQAKLLEAGA